jgi:hypothetical protein
VQAGTGPGLFGGRRGWGSALKEGSLASHTPARTPRFDGWTRTVRVPVEAASFDVRKARRERIGGTVVARASDDPVLSDLCTSSRAVLRGIQIQAIISA